MHQAMLLKHFKMLPLAGGECEQLHHLRVESNQKKDLDSVPQEIQASEAVFPPDLTTPPASMAEASTKARS